MGLRSQAHAGLPPLGGLAVLAGWALLGWGCWKSGQADA